VVLESLPPMKLAADRAEVEAFLTGSRMK